jgi:predicted kinase
MAMPHPPRVILVTGIMASGKSTVAERLAERLPRSAHVRGDTFRTMVVNGRAEFELPPSEEAWRQVLLRYRIAASVIEHYLDAGFTVVYQDVILGPALAAVARTLMHHALHVVVLHTDPEIAAARDAQRDKDAYAHESPDDYLRVLREETPRLGLWLDTSDTEVDDTVAQILGRLDLAAVGPGDLTTRG